jgi:transposase
LDLQGFDKFARMKRTRKWEYVKQEALRLAALGLSPYAIAKRLELSHSTVTRWKHAGKLDWDPGQKPIRPVTVPQTPERWAAEVRKLFALDATDDQLVTQAQQALELAYNMAESATTRLSAMGRFQSIVKQMALVTRSAGLESASTPEPDKRMAPRPMVRRSGVDPRSVLQAVK